MSVPVVFERVESAGLKRLSSMQRLEQGELGVTCKAAARAMNRNDRSEAVLGEEKAISVKRWMNEKGGCEEAVLDERGEETQ